VNLKYISTGAKTGVGLVWEKITKIKQPSLYRFAKLAILANTFFEYSQHALNCHSMILAKIVIQTKPIFWEKILLSLQNSGK
jgi:hypothetical protein